MPPKKPKPKPKPPPRKPKPKPKPPPRVISGHTPATNPGGTQSPHSTLDLAAMEQGGTTPADATQVTTEGGPAQDSAVFSTGPDSAEMLHYQQMTTYQEVYGQQIAQSQAQSGSGA